MILSAPATIAQLGFDVQAAAVSGVLKTLAAVRICERASNVASGSARSAAKSAGK